MQEVEIWIWGAVSHRGWIYLQRLTERAHAETWLPAWRSLRSCTAGVRRGAVTTAAHHGCAPASRGVPGGDTWRRRRAWAARTRRRRRHRLGVAGAPSTVSICGRRSARCQTEEERLQQERRGCPGDRGGYPEARGEDDGAGGGPQWTELTEKAAGVGEETATVSSAQGARARFLAEGGRGR
jgi:hypothetical protein